MRNVEIHELRDLLHVDIIYKSRQLVRFGLIIRHTTGHAEVCLFVCMCHRCRHYRTEIGQNITRHGLSELIRTTQLIVGRIGVCHQEY